MKIVFEPEGKKCEVNEGSTILDAAKEIGIDIKSDCGGVGSCGKCKVVVEEGSENVSSPSQRERDLLGDEIDEGKRLACLTKVSGDVLVTVPKESKKSKQVILTDGLELDLKVNPVVKKYRLDLEEASLKNDLPDFERIKKYLKNKYDFNVNNIPLKLLQKLPKRLRDNNRFTNPYTATVLKDNLIDLEKGWQKQYYGLAFDIGTTTIVCYLLNMQTGETIQTASKMNPQIKYGEDVMSRVTKSFREEDGLEKLSNSLINCLNDLINEVVEEADIGINDVYEATVVGNTGMHHLFAGIWSEYVSKSPYVQAVGKSVDLDPASLGLDVSPTGNVHLLPTVSGWMGADTIGCLLTTTPYKQEEVQLMIDVGTNGELVLGNKEKMIGASCAAGPALEGAHIKFGMRAAPGAIQYVRIDKNTYEPELDTIEDESARGICGSGIIDIVAELFRTNIINKKGRFNEEIDSDRVRESEVSKGCEYVICWKEDSSLDQDIVITLDDIREVQLAKGAICAGSHILLEKFGIDAPDEIVIAGAFGNYIDKVSASIMGLLPEVDPDKISMAGNAAGIGAKLALLDEEKRKEAERIRDEVKYLRLAALDDFDKEFARAQWFPHMNREKYYPNFERILKARRNKFD